MSRADEDIESMWNSMIRSHKDFLELDGWKELDAAGLAELMEGMEAKLLAHVGKMEAGFFVLDSVRVELDEHSYTRYPLTIVARFELKGEGTDEKAFIQATDPAQYLMDEGYDLMAKKLYEAVGMESYDVSIRIH